MKHTVKLFIHDSFLDAFATLPKKIQKKTRQFMKKFKSDPTSSAINYEKINTFRDQSLRTVRIDQKYRAIMQAPEEGDGYHLLWVDNHDEAMDWAKNKVFEWNQNTQSFQMYDFPEKDPILPVTTQRAKDSGELSSTIPPLSAQFSQEQLASLGTPPHMVDSVLQLKDAAGLDRIKQNLPIDNYEYLFYLMEGISIEDILEEINAGKSKSNEQQSLNAQKHVYILTNDEDLERVLSGDFEKWKVFLHPTQRSLAYRDFKGPLKITGGAGTGKTVCAMHRVKYLVEKMKVFDRPVLFTTYTKSLTRYLKSTIKDFDLSESSVVITNFDKLVFDLAKDERYQVIPAESGYLSENQEKEMWAEALEYQPSTRDETFFFAEYNEVILKNNVQSLEEYLRTSRVGRSIRIGRRDKLEIWKVVEEFRKRKSPNYSKFEICNLLTEYFRKTDHKPFSHLVCDEIQDFTNVELRLMRAMVDEKENDLFLVGDPFQNIYNRKVNFSASGINIRGRRSRKLKVNYRTTEEIKRLAVVTINDQRFEDFDGGEETSKGYISLLHGNEPEYQVFPTPEKEEEFLSQKLKTILQDRNVSPSDICICSRTNTGVNQVKRFLTKQERKYLDLSSSKTGLQAIRVSSFHNLKGHEFRFVVVTGVAKDQVPFRHPGFAFYSDSEKAQYIKQEKSLYYVVFTRAIQGLVVMGVGEKSDWFLD